MENEIPPVNRVDQIREELMALQGQRLKVRANMGRSRIVERTGTLVNAHPSLFVIEVEERRGRTARQSFQYVDVLTGTIELYDTNTGERCSISPALTTSPTAPHVGPSGSHYSLQGQRAPWRSCREGRARLSSRGLRHAARRDTTYTSWSRMPTSSSYATSLRW